MPVQLDADGYPLSWGDSIDGEDIPDPPDSEHRWTGSEWVPDTPQRVRESQASELGAVLARLEALQAEIDAGHIPDRASDQAVDAALEDLETRRDELRDKL